MRKYASPAFQHRHYALVARTIAELDDSLGPDAASKVAMAFMRDFEADNPRFDSARFYAAARGVPSNGNGKDVR